MLENLQRCIATHGWLVWNAQDTCLDEKIPDATGFVDINFNQFARLSSPQLPTSPCKFTHEGLLDDKVRFWQDTQLGTKRLFRRAEEME